MFGFGHHSKISLSRVTVPQKVKSINPESIFIAGSLNGNTDNGL